MKWQLSHLTKRELLHPGARWELQAAGRGPLSSALAKERHGGSTGLPCLLHPQVGRKIEERQVLLISHAFSRSLAASLCCALSPAFSCVHVFLARWSKPGARCYTARHLTYSRLCRGGTAKSSTSDPGHNSPASDDWTRDQAVSN